MHTGNASVAAPENVPGTGPGTGEFFGKRIMSLLGIAPLGVYVVLHLWTNLSSLGGPQVFNAALIETRRHPAFIALELLLGAAILVHAILGIVLMLQWRRVPGGLRPIRFGHLKFTLQRIAGLGVGLFLVAHVVKARILPALSPAGYASWQHMLEEAFGEPISLLVYVLGLLGVSYHLANGLWTFLITWGFTVTPRAQRIAQWVSIALFGVLLLMSGLCIYGFLQPMNDTYVQAS